MSIVEYDTRVAEQFEWQNKKRLLSICCAVDFVCHARSNAKNANACIPHKTNHLTLGHYNA